MPQSTLLSLSLLRALPPQPPAFSSLNTPPLCSLYLEAPMSYFFFRMLYRLLYSCICSSIKLDHYVLARFTKPMTQISKILHPSVHVATKLDQLFNGRRFHLSFFLVLSTLPNPQQVPMMANHHCEPDRVLSHHRSTMVDIPMKGRPTLECGTIPWA